jgi:uncharacterized membrane protein YfcA
MLDGSATKVVTTGFAGAGVGFGGGGGGGGGGAFFLQPAAIRNSENANKMALMVRLFILNLASWNLGQSISILLF